MLQYISRSNSICVVVVFRFAIRTAAVIVGTVERVEASSLALLILRVFRAQLG